MDLITISDKSSHNMSSAKKTNKNLGLLNQNGAGFNEDVMPASDINIDLPIETQLDSILQKTEEMIGGDMSEQIDLHGMWFSTVTDSKSRNKTEKMSEKMSVTNNRMAGGKHTTSEEIDSIHLTTLISRATDSKPTQTDTRGSEGKTVLEKKEEDESESLSDVSSETESTISFGQAGGKLKKKVAHKSRRKPVKVDIVEQREYPPSKVGTNEYIMSESSLFTNTE